MTDIHHNFEIKEILKKGISFFNMNTDICNVESFADIMERVKDNPSRIEFQKWYTEVYNYGWGPEAKRFPLYKPSQMCLRSLSQSDDGISSTLHHKTHSPLTLQQQIQKRAKLVKLLRDRIVTVSKLYVGLNYQHHHLPTWNPQLLPQSLVNEYLHQLEGDPNKYIDDTGDFIEQRQFTGPGIDCSNFTAWIYNIALGVKFTSGIEEQAGTFELDASRQKALVGLQQRDREYIDQITNVNNTGQFAFENSTMNFRQAPGRVLRPTEKYEPGDLIFLWPKSSILDPTRRTRIEHVLLYLGNGQIINSSTTQPEGVKIEPLANFKSRIAWARRIVE